MVAGPPSLRMIIRLVTLLVSGLLPGLMCSVPR
jgi:hypothetical protein